MGDLFNNQSEQAKPLKIKSKSKAKLSKSQKRFNQLSARLENLQKEVVLEKVRLNNLLSYHANHIIPAQKSMAEKKIILARLLASKIRKNKFGKVQFQKIKRVIVGLCRQAFPVMQPDAETEKFYDEWADVSYRDEVKAEKEDLYSDLADSIREDFGIEIDPDDIPDSEADMAVFFKNLQEKLRGQAENGEIPGQKKSAKKTAETEQAQKENELQSKTVRSIYISLAKILHPDTETDPGLKAEKDELMKKVTVAYDEGDLATLLKLELQWVHRQSNRLEEIAEDTLGIYIKILSEQVSELSEEIAMMRMHPRYFHIGDYLDFSEKEARHYMEKEAETLKIYLKDIKSTIKEFETQGTKPLIMEFVNYFNEMLDIQEAEMMDDDDDFDADYFVDF